MLQYLNDYDGSDWRKSLKYFSEILNLYRICIYEQRNYKYIKFMEEICIRKFIEIYNNGYIIKYDINEILRLKYINNKRTNIFKFRLYCKNSDIVEIIEILNSLTNIKCINRYISLVNNFISFTLHSEKKIQLYNIIKFVRKKFLKYGYCDYEYM